MRFAARWLPLAKQLLFGWDTIIGIGVYATLSLFIFHQPADLWTLAFAGYCAYLPDTDFIPFLLLRRRFNVTVGHWVFGHYPPIVLPVLGLFVWLISSHFWPDRAVFLTVLGVVCTALHFVHDSAAQRGGFHLLAPFTSDWKIRFTLHDPYVWNHYRVGWPWIIRKELRGDVSTIYAHTEELAKREGGGDEIAGRVEKVTKSQQITSIIVVFELFLLLIQNGYRPLW